MALLLEEIMKTVLSAFHQELVANVGAFSFALQLVLCLRRDAKVRQFGDETCLALEHHLVVTRVS